MEVRKEIDELGGWWRFIKKFGIFLKFMWPFDDALLQLRFILTLFVVIAGRFINVYKPLQSAVLLDALASGADPWRPLVVVIAIDMADSVSSYVVQLLWIDVSLQRASKLKVEVHSKIMSLDFSFYSQAQLTDLIKAIDNAGSVDTLLDSIFQLGPNLVTFVVAIVQLFHRYGLYVILICTHTAAYYSIVEKRYATVATTEYDKCNTLRDEQERRRQDSIRGWGTVSNHNRVKYETDLFSSAVESWMSRLRRYRMSCYGFGAIQAVILSLGLFTCYAFVVYKVYYGEGLVVDLVAFTGLWDLLLDPINYFTSVVSDTIQELLDAARLRRILERKPYMPNGDENLERKIGKIEFRDVSFSYPGSERLIIDHLSTVIGGGSTIAFVGQSGAGKSTICNLLMRNLVPTAGTILIDDQDIRTLKKDS
jgi:ABC-type multidrug transport system fused ATPase/permease subunit